MPDQASGALSPLLRSRRIRAALPHLAGGVLDYGCGTGHLADHVPAPRYVGLEPDADSLAAARRRHPGHRFVAAPDDLGGQRFDTVVALAVIEHVPDPAGLLRALAALLAPGGRVVLTTPHPRLRAAYEVGARLRLFSPHAADDHEEMLGEAELRSCAEAAGLRVLRFRRFLAGANQLMIAG